MVTTDLNGAMRRPYRARRVASDANSFEVTLPPEFIEREARSRNLEVDTFLKTFQCVAYFDVMGGIFYRFEEK